MKKTLTIQDSDGVVRVDKFLADKHPEYSRAAIAKLFTLKLIKHKGESILPGYKLRPGATFEYDLGPLAATPEIIDLPVLYEDDDVIVIDKPAGIISHARGRFWQEASVASFVRDKVTKGLEKAVSQNSELRTQNSHRVGIVHRLDRATSGVMICAKNEQTLSFLQKQFSDRTVTKTYIAITTGVPTHTEAIVNAPIARDPKTPKLFRIDAEGKEAQTHFMVESHSERHARVTLTPKTGRTHQLRIHLAHINTPIVGDELYGQEKAARMMLHAYSLAIRIPSNPETITTFTAPLPSDFEAYA